MGRRNLSSPTRLTRERAYGLLNSPELTKKITKFSVILPYQAPLLGFVI